MSSIDDTELTKRLVDSAAALVQRLDALAHIERNSDSGFSVIVYLDEAHTLQRTSRGQEDLYTSLMRVLCELTSEETPIFFVFLSTNSKLISFEPTDIYYPSLRVFQGRSLVPPFFELPFDINYSSESRVELTLQQSCSLEHIAKAGRSM